MSTTHALNVRASYNWSITKTTDAGNSTISSAFSFADALSEGTGVDAHDLVYIKNHTISASGNLQLDLAGALEDPFGDATVFARIKGVLIIWDPDNTASSITVGGGSDGTGTAAFVGWFGATAHKEVVHKSGVFFKFRADATGWPVTATTADILRITNDDSVNSAMIQIVIVGCSA